MALGLAVLIHLAGNGRLQVWWAEHAAAPLMRLGNGHVPIAVSEPGASAFRAAFSGNEAFDHHLGDSQSRLNENRRELQAYLERLRKARDRAEFDAFMAGQRQGLAKAEAPTPTEAPV